ncbi:flagellar basal-body rod protein FlgG [Aestuariicella sp. G3-2]|uniref:flagellar basal-body rod protein FlgG n=1 Tax=Pseudomaricurvus albidus TaxID=2842452 RepID=UPI001C0BACDB|nr:flagellar basal-body rod protein FlgG [Aestuariicella albida]MBU3071153.1 flagellar basal-body rod protein FlgG [Aestuariicella albida]
MIPALYISKTGLSAQDTQLSTISNNLANASTVGFKRERAVFEDLFYQVQRQPGAQSSQDTQLPSGLQVGTGTRIVGTQKEFTSGSMQVTGNSLDVAINGRGFFQVLGADGELAYTRNGEFHLSAEGEIVNAAGLPLQPGIVVPEGTMQLTIGDDGMVSATVSGQTDPQELGQIELADFINPAGLQAVGGNIFRQTAASGDPVTGIAGLDGMGSVKQGALENSNVDIVEEMVNMITTQRVYELNSKVVSTADQMLQYISQNL